MSPPIHKLSVNPEVMRILTDVRILKAQSVMDWQKAYSRSIHDPVLENRYRVLQQFMYEATNTMHATDQVTMREEPEGIVHTLKMVVLSYDELVALGHKLYDAGRLQRPLIVPTDK